MKEIKKTWQNWHLQRRIWRHDNINALCWSFYCVNDNEWMDVKCFQLMRCIFCYTSSLLITNAETQAKKIVRMELLH